MKEFFIVKFQFETKMQCDNKLLFEMPTVKWVWAMSGVAGENTFPCVHLYVMRVFVCAAP